MPKLNKVIIDTDCFICGNDVEVLTEAEQPGDGEHWNVYDGDKANCSDCGAEGWMALDGVSCYFAYDEMTSHNLTCLKRYNNR